MISCEHVFLGGAELWPQNVPGQSYEKEEGGTAVCLE